MTHSMLIVDDEVHIRQNLFDFFSDETLFDIKSASSGEEALSIIETFQPTVCIVDMRLTGMNGNEFILEAARRLKDCLFIIHTGSTDYQLPEPLFEIGIKDDHIFKKPVNDMTVFLDFIRRKDERSKET